MDAAPLVDVRGLVKHYAHRTGPLGWLTRRSGKTVKAVNHASFSIARGETLGLIGESGCGKSTLGRAVLRLHEPTAGKVLFDGVDVTSLDAKALKRMRSRMQIVFQDPYSSLNPRRTVEQIVSLPLQLQGGVQAREIRDRVAFMMESVGLKADYLRRYPHQFSGGQRQRIGIARALIANPAFLVCDEPVSALDVSIQAQVIQLLENLKRERGLTYLFISHDIGVIGYVSNRIAVMYLGEIVETGLSQGVLEHPAHPYTQALLSAAPRVDELVERRHRIELHGELPSPLNPPGGCKFHTRCPHAQDICRKEAPATVAVSATHSVACHLYR
ncbi:ABC transporter ATP-binding protein [Paraburkholderia susongensis]|uniref:ABC transporter ATP-binding protein n=1 Tax=Paraburkholderia susongensis TaxID=1515439 RepID=UPI001FC99A0E|nr:oligopeptide/dipeptide ABC transporter ATP-binding protein [Paraburkholderia susongensis]